LIFYFFPSPAVVCFTMANSLASARQQAQELDQQDQFDFTRHEFNIPTKSQIASSHLNNPAQTGAAFNNWMSRGFSIELMLRSISRLLLPVVVVGSLHISLRELARIAAQEDA
jgi:hypothetical protein